MYKPFFGLTKNPFGMSPDSDFLFVTSRHREAIAGLAYALCERKGFLALSGPVGTGKTTVLTWVLEHLSSERIETSVILNPVLTADEFMEMVLLGFGISEIPEGKPRRLRKLEDFLLRTHESHKVSALIVDEAHKLSPELLEEIRLLGNFERSGQKLLQILLIGQSELDDLLNRPDLCQLKQRICVRLTIGPLDRSSLANYVQHRWLKAGGQKTPFSPAVIDRLFQWSGGVPRVVNALADNALMLAYAENQAVLRVEHIDSVARELRLVAPVLRETVAPAEPVAAIPSRAAREDVPEKGVEPTRKVTVECGDQRPKAASFFSRWAGRLGLA